MLCGVVGPPFPLQYPVKTRDIVGGSVSVLVLFFFPRHPDNSRFGRISLPQHRLDTLLARSEVVGRLSSRRSLEKGSFKESSDRTDCEKNNKSEAGVVVSINQSNDW